MIVPLSTVAHKEFHPYEAGLKCGCDTSLWQRGMRRTTGKHEMFSHQLEYVAFQSYEKQISSYSRLMERWGSREVLKDPFIDLEAHYPKVYIKAIRDYYMAQNRRD